MRPITRKTLAVATAMTMALSLTACEQSDSNPVYWIGRSIDWLEALGKGGVNYSEEHNLPGRLTDTLSRYGDSYQEHPEDPVDFNKVGDKSKDLANKGKDTVKKGVNSTRSSVEKERYTARHDWDHAGAHKNPVPRTVSAAMRNLSHHQAPERSMAGYSRDKFPHWQNNPSAYGWGTVPKGCNVRKAALIRDGQHVTVTGKNCKVSGVWTDAYGVMKNGRVVYESGSNPSQFDIDHIVPLALAWRSGAATLTVQQRTQLANDPMNLVVTGRTSNRSKGDQSVVTYMPPQGKMSKKSARCDYIQRYILVKDKYRLTVTQREFRVLQQQVHYCWT